MCIRQSRDPEKEVLFLPVVGVEVNESLLSRKVMECKQRFPDILRNL